MRSIHLLFKAIVKAFTHSHQQVAFTGFYNVSKEKRLPRAILRAIDSISSERLWNWMGEYYIIPGEPDARQIIMYTSEDSLMSVHISKKGEIQSILPKGDLDFYQYPELLLSGRTIVIKSYDYTNLKRLVY